jgi:hypothetical protein
VVNSFFGLRHHAVIGGDDENDDVRNFGAASAHAGESFVTRRIDEHHATIAHGDFVRTNVLGDSAGFALGDVRRPNGVEQAGLAVVHVAHDGDHRRTRLQAFLGLFLGDLEDHLLFEGDHTDDAAEGLGQRGGRGDVERLVDAGENAAIEQGL